MSINIFNAFQLTLLLVCLPFIIAWLYVATFPFAIVACGVACFVYIGLFIYHMIAVASTLE